ncbi:hypothetical protein Pint_20213 [Pistacia integerrima]|uniref:Uncharacterized protein n=1 Tax=Pistacia integerrima TaxID=434235 RepID=A0ACC0XEQ9_9ROSI|nr:hypothetical protein Pint_20213 [Pistacia integerrima]
MNPGRSLWIYVPSSIRSLSMANSFYKIFLLIFFCFWASIDAGTDTLMQGDMLNSSVPLVSRNGKFTLSFFRSPQRSGNGWYLGVSSGDNIESQSIWVANREMPIRDDSVVLLIDETGSLLIKHNSRDSIKLFSGQSRTNLAAVLLDDGNFVLKETNSDGTANSEPLLWQSFDLPTNSFWPGMKLGINDKTGQNWSLRSWLSYSLPIPGAFSLEWYPLEEELIVKRRGVDFWTSGRLLCSSFENIEVFTPTANYFFRQYSDGDGKYLNHTATPCYEVDGNSVTSLWLMSDGSLVDTLTHKYLFVSSLCDGNTTDFGCKKWEDLSCRDGQKLERRTISNNDPQIIRVSDNRTDLSLSDCKDMCWKNCTCVGVQEKGPNPDGTGCTFLSGPLKEMKNGERDLNIPNVDEAFYIIIPAPSEKQSIWKWILISVAAAAALVVIFFLGFFLFIRWRRLCLEGNTLNRMHEIFLSAWELWREGAVLELVHPTLRDSCFEDPVLRCINVALLCVEHNPVDRPSMSAVICMLGSDVVKLTKPKQPAFSTERIPVDQDNSKEIKAENCTINNLTISVLDPR